jgi:hypothetical protein
MSEPLRRQVTRLTVGRRQMLFSVPLDESDLDGDRIFTDTTTEPDDTADVQVQPALSVIGAWSDLDWDQALDTLDRIRHESRPTPIIDEP